MKKLEPREMSAEHLVERFTSIALAQDEADLLGQHSKYNRLYDEMETVKTELKSRDDDLRRALLPLVEHSNPQVRLKAAIAVLALEPEIARATLQKIWDAKEFPQAAHASGMLDALNEGRYVPS